MSEDTKAFLIVGGVFAFVLLIPAILAGTTKTNNDEANSQQFNVNRVLINKKKKLCQI